MKKVFVFVGPPGSGKSFRVASFKGTLLLDKDVVRISSDQIRLSLTGSEEDHSRDKEVWQILFEALKSSLINPAINYILLDTTAAKPSYRKDFIKTTRILLPSAEITAVWVNTSLQTCLERNKSRERVVPEDVIVRMHTQIKNNPPSLIEGFDRVLKEKE